MTYRHFTIEGSAPFPLEMLALDRCCPAYVSDAVAIHQTLIADEPVRRRLHMWLLRPGEPTRDAWERHGWRVVSFDQ